MTETAKLCRIFNRIANEEQGVWPDWLYDAFGSDCGGQYENQLDLINELLSAAERAAKKYQDSTCIVPACECEACHLSAVVAKFRERNKYL